MRLPHRSTRLLALVIALLLPLAASACGDDDSDDSSDGGSTTTEQEESSPSDDTAADASSTTAGSDDEDALAAAIQAQADELGIEDTVVEGDTITLVMADGTDDAGVEAACAFAAGINPDAGEISVEVDGETTPC